MNEKNLIAVQRVLPAQQFIMKEMATCRHLYQMDQNLFLIPHIIVTLLILIVSNAILRG